MSPCAGFQLKGFVGGLRFLQICRDCALVLIWLRCFGRVDLSRVLAYVCCLRQYVGRFCRPGRTLCVFIRTFVLKGIAHTVHLPVWWRNLALHARVWHMRMQPGFAAVWHLAAGAATRWGMGSLDVHVQPWHVQLSSCCISGALVDSVRSGGVWCVVLRKDCMCIVLGVYVCCDRPVCASF